MGPGRVTTTGEASITTVESAQRATHGSLQLLASGVGQRHRRGMGHRVCSTTSLAEGGKAETQSREGTRTLKSVCLSLPFSALSPTPFAALQLSFWLCVHKAPADGVATTVSSCDSSPVG